MKLKNPRSLASRYRPPTEKKKRENSDKCKFVRKFLMPPVQCFPTELEEIAENKGIARSKLFLDVARFLVLNKGKKFTVCYSEWPGSREWRAVMSVLQVPEVMSEREIFDLYGLIVGMMYREEMELGRDGIPSRPAKRWVRYFENHPSIVKARKIYERISAESMRSGARL